MRAHFELEMAFKGERRYLHGSDFFNHAEGVLAREIGPGFVARLIFRRFAVRQCDLLIGDEIPIGYCGEGSFLCDDGLSLRFWLTESQRPVSGRYSFDEDGLVASAIVDSVSRSAALESDAPLTPIEKVIALTKLLHYRLMPDIHGKWVFAQLDLVEPLRADFSRLAVRMLSLIPGRFSVNEIQTDGRTVGRINFVVAKP